MLECPFCFSSNIVFSATVDPMCTKYSCEQNLCANLVAFLILSASEEGGLQSDHVFNIAGCFARPLCISFSSFFRMCSEHTTGFSAWTSTVESILAASPIIEQRN